MVVPPGVLSLRRVLAPEAPAWFEAGLATSLSVLSSSLEHPMATSASVRINAPCVSSRVFKPILPSNLTIDGDEAQRVHAQ